MRFVKTLVLGITLAAAAHGLHAQAKPAAGGTATGATVATKAASQGAKPADKAAAQPVTKGAASPSATQTKPATPATNKPAAPVTNKPATPVAKPVTSASGPASSVKPAAAAAKPAPKQRAQKVAPKPARAKSATSSAPAQQQEPKVAKRDPFESMVGREQAANVGSKTNLPPGKAGLQVGSLRLDGIVRAPNGMIAVVSNPQSRTYFLREGDQLYDGRVEKIAMDGVSFHEVGKDAFGKPVERQVNKRIYASAGEQQ